MEIKTKLILSLLGGVIVNFFTPVLPLLESIGLLVVIDIVTGMLAAKYFLNEDLTSRKFFKKIIQTGVFALGLVAFLIADPNLLEFGLPQHAASKLYCALYAFYELISIVENLGRMNLPIAKNILELLKAKLPQEVKEQVEKLEEKK